MIFPEQKLQSQKFLRLCANVLGAQLLPFQSLDVQLIVYLNLYITKL
jgi:hypothetical protein